MEKQILEVEKNKLSQSDFVKMFLEYNNLDLIKEHFINANIGLDSIIFFPDNVFFITEKKSGKKLKGYYSLNGCMIILQVRRECKEEKLFSNVIGWFYSTGILNVVHYPISFFNYAE